jgi:Fe-S-cluster containining protein
MGLNSLNIPRLRFECTGCGACCTQRGEYAHVYVNNEEAKRLARFLGLSVRSFRKRHTFRDDGGWTQLRFRDGACSFLDPATNRCTVYDARPVQCRTYPYWPELFGPTGWNRKAMESCEGLGRGAIVPPEEVIAAIRAMEERDRADE